MKSLSSLNGCKCLISALIALAVLTSKPNLAVATDMAETREAAEIVDLYHRVDAAYSRTDLDGVTAIYMPEWFATDKAGNRRTLTDVVEQTRKMWQPTPGVQWTWHLLTDVTALQVKGDVAYADVSTQLDLVRRDELTYVHIRTLATGKDEWTHTTKGWRVRSTRLLSSKQIQEGRPSEYAIGQLQNMRTMNNQLRDFNRSNNMSNCMYSTGMQKFDYWERQERCSN